MPEASLIAAPRRGALVRAVGTAWATLRPYAVLEARRNRVLYGGWPLVILGTLPLSAAIAGAVDITAGQGMSAALAAWATVGLPITAVLFGAVAGAGLRGTADEADAALPLSPRQRAFGALAATTTAFVGNAVLVAVLVAATSSDARDLLSGFASLGNWGSVAGYVAAMATITGFSVAWIITAAFAAAYAASHAVLGGVVALLGAALLLLPVGAGISLLFNHGPHLAMPFLAAAMASTAASLGGAALSLAQTAPAAARCARLSWGRLALLCLLPLAGSVTAWPAMWSAGRRVKAQLEQVWGGGWDSKDTLPGQHQKRRAGLMQGLGGRLVRQTAGGTIVLLPGSDPALGEMVLHGRGHFEHVTGAFIDNDGRVWAEVRAPFIEGQPTVLTVWAGDGKGPLTRYMTLPPNMDLAVHDGRAAIDTSPLILDDAKYVFLDPAKPPVLKPR